MSDSVQDVMHDVFLNIETAQSKIGKISYFASLHSCAFCIDAIQSKAGYVDALDLTAGCIDSQSKAVCRDVLDYMLNHGSLRRTSIRIPAGGWNPWKP